MTQDEKEIAELLTKYHTEIVNLVKEVTNAVSMLDSARKEFVKKNWFERNEKYFLAVLIPAAIVTLCVIGFKISDGDIRYGDFSISKRVICQNSTSTR